MADSPACNLKSIIRIKPNQGLGSDFWLVIISFNCFCPTIFTLTISKHAKSERINMTRAWDKEKNLSPELKIHHLYSLITTHDDFDSADPSSMQDACHIWTQLNDLMLSMSTCSSVDRMPAQCLGGHWFDSCQELRFFFPMLVSSWSIHLSCFITKNSPFLLTHQHWKLCTNTTREINYVQIVEIRHMSWHGLWLPKLVQKFSK